MGENAAGASATSVTGTTSSGSRAMSCAAPLDIDMGNTRTKWRCGGAAGALPGPELPMLSTRPSRVRVATVLRNADELAAAVRDRFGLDAEFATVSPCLAGVRCGYRDPARLGVDRWLAAVAAWRRTRTATVVVSAGTAATVDFVHADGRHETGLIAPGLRLMRTALARRTADVRVSAGNPVGAGGEVPAVDTERAVDAGTLTMLLGFAEAAVTGFAARCTGAPTVFATGGDAPLLVGGLSERLFSPCRHAPQLVLDGLAIALP